MTQIQLLNSTHNHQNLTLKLKETVSRVFIKLSNKNKQERPVDLNRVKSKIRVIKEKNANLPESHNYKSVTQNNHVYVNVYVRKQVICTRKAREPAAIAWLTKFISAERRVGEIGGSLSHCLIVMGEVVDVRKLSIVLVRSG